MAPDSISGIIIGSIFTISSVLEYAGVKIGGSKYAT